jgi:hypothetical protein
MSVLSQAFDAGSNPMIVEIFIIRQVLMWSRTSSLFEAKSSYAFKTCDDVQATHTVHGYSADYFDFIHFPS